MGEQIFHVSTLFFIPGVNFDVLLWHLCCLEHPPKYLGLFWGLFYVPLAEVLQLAHLPDYSLEVHTKFSWFRLFIFCLLISTGGVCEIEELSLLSVCQCLGGSKPRYCQVKNSAVKWWRS